MDARTDTVVRLRLEYLNHLVKVPLQGGDALDIGRWNFRRVSISTHEKCALQARVR